MIILANKCKYCTLEYGKVVCPYKSDYIVELEAMHSRPIRRLSRIRNCPEDALRIDSYPGTLCYLLVDNNEVTDWSEIMKMVNRKIAIPYMSWMVYPAEVKE